MTVLCAPGVLVPPRASESLTLDPTVKLHFSRTDAHARLVADKVRIGAFQRAIHDVIKPGDAVLDIGAGTGVLSEYAIRAGASSVCLVEENSNILDLARRRLAKYAWTADLHFCECRSTSLAAARLPCVPDCIISETIGSLAFNEGLALTLNDARRFASATTRFIPNRVRLIAAAFQAELPAPLSKTPVVNRSISDVCLLASPVSLYDWSVPSCPQGGSLHTTMLLPSHSDGIAFWAKADLSPKCRQSTFQRGARNSWGRLLWSLPGYVGKYTVGFRFAHSACQNPASSISGELSKEHSARFGMEQVLDAHLAVNLSVDVQKYRDHSPL